MPGSPRNTDAKSTNEALCEIFRIALQQRPPFQSDAFIQYWENKGVKVRKSIPTVEWGCWATESGDNQSIICIQVRRHKLETSLATVRSQPQLFGSSFSARVTPFQLMVGWKNRGTFVSLWNAARGTKESLMVSRAIHVLCLKHENPTFSGERLKVLAREGAKITLVTFKMWN